MDFLPIQNSQRKMSVSTPIGVSQDFETFLKMLTTQIQNQDPLSPMQADQFATQLASFSMVEQQTLTNQKMEALASIFESSRIASYADMVGRLAFHAGPFNFSGPEVPFDLGNAAWNDGTYKISILNYSGSVVKDLFLPEDQTRVVWDGTAQDGRPLSAGIFTAEIRRISDEVPLNVPIYTGDLVEEVRFEDNGAKLVLANGSVISQADVSKVR